MHFQTLHRVAFLAMLAVVLVLSLLPIDHPEMSPNDKLNHFIAYMALTISGYLGFHRLWRISAVVFSFGVLVEILQGMTSYRYMSVLDIVANSVGVIIAGAVILLFGYIRARRNSKQGIK